MIEAGRDDQALILSKLAPPKLPAGLVQRQHNIEWLDDAASHRITLISAPAGYGKSMLVSQWLNRDSAPPVAWLSLDILDNDIERFVQYVVAALRQAVPGCLEETQKVLLSRNLPSPQHLAELMLVEIERLGQQVVLVLDDYGLIKNRCIHDLLESMVSHLPPTLHLLITSRIDPPLPTSQWRKQQWLSELRITNLRFSRDETKRFFMKSKKLKLSDEGLEEIYRKTEGWVTGMRLVQLSLAESQDPNELIKAFSTNDQLITDYLFEEVLEGQPQEIKEFLAITSLLDRFSPGLCDELLKGLSHYSGGHSRKTLKRLFKKNLFLLSLGPVHGWYRYHHLFKELLLERFESLSPNIARRDILKHAGNWFCKEGWIEDGLKCLLEAGELDDAADVIARHLHKALEEDPSQRTLGLWIRMFPSGAEKGRLPLLVARSYLMVLRTDYEGVGHLLEDIETTCNNPTSDRQQTWCKIFRNDLDFLYGFYAFWKGDIESTYQNCSRVFEQLSDPRGGLVGLTIMYFGGSLALTGRKVEYRQFIDDGIAESGSSDGSRQMPLLVAKAAGHMYKGELSECRKAASRLTLSTEYAIPKYFEGIGYYLLGVVAYERNCLDEAAAHFRAVETRRFDVPGMVYIGANAALAKIELAQGNLDAANQRLRLSHEFALESASSTLLHGSKAVESLLAVASGKTPGATLAPPADPDFMHWSITPLSHGWIWTQVQSPSVEKRQAALEYTEAALKHAEAHAVTQRVIQLSTLQALLLHAQDRRIEAISVLEAALKQGAALGFVRSFIDYGGKLLPLLYGVAERVPDDAYICSLLDAVGAPRQPGFQQIDSLSANTMSNAGAHTHSDDTVSAGAVYDGEPLTNREKQVLKMLQERYSNKEIAARFGISASTVKMHTLGIYGKLGVHSRRQAVNAAVKLGILID